MVENLPEGPASDPSVRVLYIGGTGRTGSTLLSSLLGQYPAFFSAGEVAFLWRFGLVEGGLCSCGTPIRECRVWLSIFDRAYGGLEHVDGAEMVRIRRKFNSVHLPLMVTNRQRERLMHRASTFSEATERLYNGIAAATGSRVVVDSSKEPHYSYILRECRSLDVRFLHLVRDPRAVAYSWQRRKAETGLGGGAYMERRRPTKSAAYFDVSNVAAEVMWAREEHRYLRIRYEDFIARPGETLRTIAAFAGEAIDPSSVIHGDGAELAGTHSVWGNPNRFDRGRVTLGRDDAWRHALSRVDQGVVTAATLPLLRHYRYPVWVHARG